MWKTYLAESDPISSSPSSSLLAYASSSSSAYIGLIGWYCWRSVGDNFVKMVSKPVTNTVHVTSVTNIDATIDFNLDFISSIDNLLIDRMCISLINLSSILWVTFIWPWGTSGWCLASLLSFFIHIYFSGFNIIYITINIVKYSIVDCVLTSDWKWYYVKS